MADIDLNDLRALERHASYFYAQYESAATAWNGFREQLGQLPAALEAAGEQNRLPEFHASLVAAGLPAALVDDLLGAD